jgi:hypothetical protein
MAADPHRIAQEAQAWKSMLSTWQLTVTMPERVELQEPFAFMQDYMCVTRSPPPPQPDRFVARSARSELRNFRNLRPKSSSLALASRLVASRAAVNWPRRDQWRAARGERSSLPAA